MNVAIVLAGGSGTRVGANVPKQFIEIWDKPILAYTIENFQKNPNIDAIEIVCHKDWIEKVNRIIQKYALTKTKWITIGGNSFQESVMNGVFNLRDKIADDDIVIITFGVSPQTPAEDVDDSIRVCKLHGNAIAAADIDLCTCIKDDPFSSTQNLLRERLKGFSNPWTFKFGELCEAYEIALSQGFLETLEPHTTSLYFKLGKRIWFSQCTTSFHKITHREDVDAFAGMILLDRYKNQNKDKLNDQL